ncbi:unnamed protein product, partial [Phaeothamnion confervicola]
ELLVLAAEACLAAGCEAAAAEALHEFFLDDHPKDHFHCRALFAQARVWAAMTDRKRLTGAAAVRQRRRAADAVRAALALAALPQNAPRYHFVAYNASLHLWAVVRPAMRPGTARLYCADLTAAADALDAAADPDLDWRCRMHVAAAVAADDAGE